MELVLTRRYHAKGTNGILRHNSNFLCYTIELPWLDNQPQVSCIPEGRYRLQPRFSIRHKTHLLLQQVRGRALILIHAANDAIRELRGCIAPVTKLTGIGKGSLSRTACRKVLDLVLEAVDDGPVYLTIKS